MRSHQTGPPPTVAQFVRILGVHIVRGAFQDAQEFVDAPLADQHIKTNFVQVAPRAVENVRLVEFAFALLRFLEKFKYLSQHVHKKRLTRTSGTVNVERIVGSRMLICRTEQPGCSPTANLQKRLGVGFIKFAKIDELLLLLLNLEWHHTALKTFNECVPGPPARTRTTIFLTPQVNLHDCCVFQISFNEAINVLLRRTTAILADKFGQKMVWLSHVREQKFLEQLQNARHQLVEHTFAKGISRHLEAGQPDHGKL